ncbi:PREDICTED: beta-casein isoform X2 [Mandrillus leucophaeus]|uniref:beta-casein isoform X2 n=1 Tax=Mandrillus leucophaeus TaxID=9568 RepID=UPI0005F48514|nr:PREDICTED: beta-casein isoform X2 [Mandrillus leucophaeus]
MKVIILACLVALALARETVENLSSSEESITQYKTVEKVKHEDQQQREDERQDKIDPSFQPQPLIYPFVEPIPYGFLPQNILPLAQPAVVLPVPQPEIMEVPKAKDTIYTKGRVMPVHKSPAMPFFEPQIPKLTDFENLHLPLPLFQPLMHQVSQPIPQTLALPPQPLWSVPQPKVLPIPQQVVPYPQRAVPVQALLLSQELLLDPTHQIYPVAQPLAPVHNPIRV